MVALLVLLSITAASVLCVFLGKAGLEIPFLRQLTGFVFLTVVPGLLILRLLRFRNLGPLDTILYAAGISIAVVMFLGLFMNAVYPSLGISRPIEAVPIVSTLAVVVLAMAGLWYLRRRREAFPPGSWPPLPWREALSPPVLLLLLLPFLAVLGAYTVSVHSNNIVLVVLLVLIALVAVMIALNRFIPPRLYPLAIFMVSISLLWHWSLISSYLYGYDIHYEYYHQFQVLADGFWNADIRSNVNSMLSIVMLAPIYSLVLGVESVWIFKVVYPLFFALLPLALFQIFRCQSHDRLGFLAVFLFISYSAFFVDMSQLGRQQVAEVFFALFVMALLDTAMTDGKKKLLIVIFGVSIVVSHYGLAYFFLFYLVLSALILVLLQNRRLNHRLENLRARFAGSADKGPSETAVSAAPTATTIFIMIVFCFVWYLYIGRGTPFNSIVNIGVNTVNNLEEIFIVESREAGALMALGLASPEVASVPRQIFLALQYVIEFFIIAGVIVVVLKGVKSGFQPLFVAVSLVSLVLLVMCLVLPRFSMNFNIGRFYHISLLFLSPFGIIGGVTVLRGIYRVVSMNRSRPVASPVFLSIVGVAVLVPYFLFYSGVAYVLTGDKVTSMALNPDLDTVKYNQREATGRDWLQQNAASGYGVMADQYGQIIFKPAFPRRTMTFRADTQEVSDYVYIYLRTINAKQDLVSLPEEENQTYVSLSSSDFGREVLSHRSRIYDNGGSQVYDIARLGGLPGR